MQLVWVCSHKSCLAHLHWLIYKLDIRFKNQGLDLIEVQDNGSGISPANYDAVALKHHTSKLSSYSDIASLETFGFRGEALSSLCALSTLTVTTCLASDVPKGAKLTFEPSGKLNGTSVVAAQRGTTVSVNGLFHNLPVRRRELERNIKREWQKVIALLNQYACIQTKLKFSVSQQPNKGKRILLFSTKGNPTTRENIINIFGAKSMTAIVPLELKLELQPTTTGRGILAGPVNPNASREVRVIGHVSRPTHGDGRQTPDRQMFFVNGRPCGLPQFAKVFNEVYRSYNSSQTPFILADIQLDTHMYDVNVSPDKRSILLHDQNDLLDNLRNSLAALFDMQDYSVPTSQLLKSKQIVAGNKDGPKGPPATPSTPKTGQAADEVQEVSSSGSDEDEDIGSDGKVPHGRARRIGSARSLSKDTSGQNLISRWVERKTGNRVANEVKSVSPEIGCTITTAAELHRLAAQGKTPPTNHSSPLRSILDGKTRPVQDFNKRLEEHSTTTASEMLNESSRSPSPAEADSMEIEQPSIRAVHVIRGQTPKLGSQYAQTQAHARPASITIGNHTLTTHLTTSRAIPSTGPQSAAAKKSHFQKEAADPSFGSRLSQLFSAGKSLADGSDGEEDIEEDHASEASTSSNTTKNADKEPPTTDDQADSIRRRRSSSSLFVTEETTVEEENNATPGELPNAEMLEIPSPDAPVAQPSIAESRGQSLRGGSRRKDATLQATQHLRLSESIIQSKMSVWKESASRSNTVTSTDKNVTDLSAPGAEEQLSLIISRKDFLKMRIIGQFNLGFIIAVRPSGSTPSAGGDGMATDDELFIIDQHATDEKYNFERLQSTTVVQSQRLVNPKRLELTALEEEIVMQNIPAIEANGFKVDVDTSGDEPVGSRCQILALPLSREITFNLSDFEELISLLGDEPTESKHIPRPSKVRKMFAMRACRSSIMIGKPLTKSQMETLVRHMGELDKPWNCPHGRPTMRHLCKLQPWDEAGWGYDTKRLSAARWRDYAGGA